MALSRLYLALLIAITPTSALRTNAIILAVPLPPRNAMAETLMLSITHEVPAPNSISLEKSDETVPPGR